jgi:hypothetical protein
MCYHHPEGINLFRVFSTPMGSGHALVRIDLEVCVAWNIDFVIPKAALAHVMCPAALRVRCGKR